MTTNELLSRDFLSSIGVVLNSRESALLNEHYELTLNHRIIEAITELLDEHQLEELRSIRASNTEVLSNWMSTNVPDFSAIVEDEVAILMGELAENGNRF